MTKLIPHSRAAAQAAAVLGACLLACALQGALAGPAAAFTPAPAPAKTGGENTPLNLGSSSSGAHASTGSGGASIVRTIVGLAIVIAVIWGLAWILRQVKAGRDPHAPSDGLASVAALTLGSGRSVHLVRAGNDYVLLGATEHGVAPIHRYTEEEAQDAGLLPDLDAPAAPPAPRSSVARGVRAAAAAGQLLLGAGRLVAQGPGGAADGGVPGEGSSGRTLPGQSLPGRPRSAQRRFYEHSPVVGARPDPMRMPSTSSGLIERLREMTVRR